VGADQGAKNHPQARHNAARRMKNWGEKPTKLPTTMPTRITIQPRQFDHGLKKDVSQASPDGSEAASDWGCHVIGFRLKRLASELNEVCCYLGWRGVSEITSVSLV
jgi:hypothetical protein